MLKEAIRSCYLGDRIRYFVDEKLNGITISTFEITAQEYKKKADKKDIQIAEKITKQNKPHLGEVY